MPLLTEAITDPDLALDLSDDDRDVMLSGCSWVLGKLRDVPHLVGGRLAALAHGLPVRVTRLDLVLAHRDRGLFADGLQQFNAVRWNDRWQEYRDLIRADRPGPMRWQLGSVPELRVALVDELPHHTRLRLGALEVDAPTLPWLTAQDPDVADLAARLDAVGWSDGGPRPAPDRPAAQ